MHAQIVSNGSSRPRPRIKTALIRTAYNNAQATSAHFPVRSGGSAQTAFRGEPAIRLVLRAARTALGACVRLLSAQPHYTLRVCAPGHLRPSSRRPRHRGRLSQNRASAVHTRLFGFNGFGSPLLHHMAA